MAFSPGGFSKAARFLLHRHTMAHDPMADDPSPSQTSDAAAPREPRTTRVFGVLGGIASGKSIVSEAIAGPDGIVLNADRIAHEVLDSTEVVERLRERFGEGVVRPDGRTDRPALAQIVFADGGARKVVEDWIHPGVRARLYAGLEDARRSGVPRVVLDVPLLLENAEEHGLVDLCDVLVFVDAPTDVRDRRAVETRGWDPGEVARRESTQLPLETKRDRADIIIRNDGDKNDLRAAVRAALARFAT